MILFFIIVFSRSSFSSASCGDGCCPHKTVGGLDYSFSHESQAALDSNCNDPCVYTMDGGDGSLVCFTSGDLSSECRNCKLPGLPKLYCQPGQDCWPTPSQLNEFSESIQGEDDSCLGLKKFVNVNTASAHAPQVCLPYTGLLNNINNIVANQFRIDKRYSLLVGGDLSVCTAKNVQNNYLQPDPNCDQNPFITGAFYQNNSDYQMACMTPYQFLNNRNYKEEWMAAFIVTAETPEDVSKAVHFARNHNLGVAVMSTGHDLLDRNAGPGQNSLLIRTTCFRDFEANKIDPIGDFDGIWTEGYARVGAGLTFGRNFWTNLTNSEGLYPLAAGVGREMVGGTCHSVGIIGWTIAGGKGWASTMYGLGVDQLLHVDLVTADGQITSANYSHNTELFYALRGGGGGFGVITAIKIKLHKPSCNGSMSNCYAKYNASWTGAWVGTPEQTEDIAGLLNIYFNWSAHFNHFWSSGMQLNFNGEDKTWSFSIGATYFGYEDKNPTSFNSFENTFKNLETQNTTKIFNSWKTDKYWCEVFPDPNNNNECTEDPWTVQRWSQSIRILANSSTLTKKETPSGKNAFVESLIQHWQPMCDNNPFSPCSAGYLVEAVFPMINITSGKGVYATGGAISNGFREISTQIMNLGVNSNSVDLTFKQQEDWMHNTLAPAMYKFSNVSYFNEAEYTMSPGQWEERFWGKEKYCKLLKIKEMYDPDMIFNCRHCVGSKAGY